jgi:tRNA pseudouridine38-40 synthase
MARYFIQLAYDGTNYHGWQVQDNASTVQAQLEMVFSTLLKEDIKFVGAGRTDTGVHASYFVAHIETDHLDLETREGFLYALNKFLPEDIVVHRITKVHQELHARFSAKYRTYHYRINRSKALFNRAYNYYYYKELDMDRIREACKVLISYTDFTSFSKLHTNVKTNNCKIYHAEWEESDESYLFEIKADRFLRNMVRSIVGTLLDVGAGKTSIQEFREIIEAMERGRAGASAPAHALFLVDIGY